MRAGGPLSQQVSLVIKLAGNPIDRPTRVVTELLAQGRNHV